MHFLHFVHNSQRPDEGKEYDRLWKLRTDYDTMNKAYDKLYSPSENLEVGKVPIKFKGRLSSDSIFQRKDNVAVSKFTNCVMNQGIHIT